MKHFLLSLTATVFLCINVWGQIQVGTGTSTSASVPIYTNYGYTYSEQIYLQSEINGTGTITSVSFYFSSGSSTNSTNWTVYIGHTSKTAYSSTTDWVNSSGMTQVFSGTVTYPASGNWLTITLTTPFVYNNTDNLVIGVDENESSYTSNSYWRYTSTSPNYRSIYYRSDGTNPDPAAPPTASGRNTYYPNVILGGLSAATPPNCTNLTTPANAATNINENTDLTWTAATGSPTGYKLTVGTTSGGTDVLNAVDVGNVTSYDIGAMDYSTTYYVTVTPYNANGDAAGCTETSFTTRADPTLTPPFTEAFVSYLPTNWTEAAGALGSPTTFSSTTSSGWIADGFANNGSSGAARINIYGTAVDEWLMTPPIDLGDGSTPYQLAFDLALTAFSSTGAAGATGTDDVFAVVISTDNGATWSSANTLRQWDNAGSAYVYNNIATAGENVIIDLSAYTGSVVIGFYGYSNISNADNDLFVDNVTVEEIPACPYPSAMAASSVTASTATLNWTENGTATTWNLEWKAGADFTPGNSEEDGSAVPTTTPTYAMSGLTDITTYYVYYQADCGGDQSTWSGPYTFTTTCVAIADFSEDFNAVTTPNLPDCWSKVIDNGASSFATVTTTSTYNSSPYGVSLYNSGSAASSNIMLVSPVLSNLSAGTHRLRFYAKNSTSSQDLQIGTLSDPTDGTTFTLFQSVDISTTFTEYTVDFSAYAGSDDYIAFRRLSTSTYTYVYIDDIVWEEILANDAEVTNIAKPADSQCPGGLSDSETITITIKNNGASTILTGEASVALSGDITAGSLTNTSDIASGATSTVEFTVDLTNPQIYDFTATVTLTGDANATNDALSATIKAAPETTTSCDFTGFTGSNLSTVFTGYAEKSGTTPSGTTSIWSNSSALGQTTAKINLYTSTRNEWIITPPVSITGSEVLVFDMAITDYNNGNVDPAGMSGTDDEVAVMISTDCGANWTKIKSFVDANVTGRFSNALTTIKGIDLSAYAGQTVQIGIYATDGPTDNSPDYDVHIDNIIIDDAANVPVELMFFRAEADDNQTALTWATATEIDNRGFEVEHSTDALNWKQIGFVEGRGNSVQVNNYNFRHTDPQNGINYYRLRQVDFEGSFAYTNVVSVTFAKTSNGGVLFPNPNLGAFTIRLDNAATNADLVVRIFNLNGQLVREINTTYQNQLDLNVETLPQGAYQLDIRNAATNESLMRQLFVKQQ